MKNLIEARAKKYCKECFNENPPINTLRIYLILKQIFAFFYGSSNYCKENFLIISFHEPNTPNIVFNYRRSDKKRFFRIHNPCQVGQSLPFDSFLGSIRALRTFESKTFQKIAKGLKNNQFTISLRGSI